MGPTRGGPDLGVTRGRGRPRRARVEQPVARPVLGARVETKRDTQILLGQLGEMASETLATIAQCNTPSHIGHVKDVGSGL